MTHPIDIGLDIADTFVMIGKHLVEKRAPHTSEDARAMAISAHIEAGRRGYQSPPRPVCEEEDIPDGKPTPEAPTPSEGTESPPTGNASYGDEYRSKTYKASGPTIGKMKGTIKDAAAMVAQEEKIGIRDAETRVKKNIINEFEEYWGFSPNLNQPDGRMNQGQCSWTIAYTQTEFGVE